MGSPVSFSLCSSVAPVVWRFLPRFEVLRQNRQRLPRFTLSLKLA